MAKRKTHEEFINEMNKKINEFKTEIVNNNKIKEDGFDLDLNNAKQEILDEISEIEGNNIKRKDELDNNFNAYKAKYDKEHSDLKNEYQAEIQRGL